MKAENPRVNFYCLGSGEGVGQLVTTIEPEYYIARRHLKKLGNKVRSKKNIVGLQIK